MVKRFPELLQEFPKSFQIFIILISNRIDKGRNCLIGVFGQTGSGKSLSMLQFIRALYLFRIGKEPTNEYLLNHLHFKAKDFMEVMKKKSDQLVQDENKVVRGECHGWDESAVEIGAKEFQSVRNKIIGWLAQTFRNLGQIVFFTTPSIHFLDKTIRCLLHYYVEAVAIDKKKKICIMKPLELQYNSRMDKIYYHNLNYPSKTEGLIEVEFMGVPKVSDELERMYEIKKNNFTQNLNAQILTTLNIIDRKNDPEERLTDRQKEIVRLMRSGIVSTGKIAEKIGVPSETISTNLQYMRNKGVDIDSIRKKSKIEEINLNGHNST